jgi:hypothetical protein
MAEKITKSKLLKEIDEKLASLNLLRSALAAEQSLKQENLQMYQTHFNELFNLTKKK